LLPSATFVNRLINELTPFLSEANRDELAIEAVDAQRVFDVVHVEGAIADCHVEPFLSLGERTALARFVELRKTRVQEFVSAAIGRPMLPFGGAVA
jgi:hypothetical protein